MSQGTSTRNSRKNGPAKSKSSKSSPAQNQTGELQPSKDFVEYLKEYAQEKPDVAALWCFGIGFVVGWKLKPW